MDWQHRWESRILGKFMVIDFVVGVRVLQSENIIFGFLVGEIGSRTKFFREVFFLFGNISATY